MSLTLKPQYQTMLAAGLDLPAAEFTFINAGETVSVDTGITLDDLLRTEDRAWPIPSGCILEAQIRGRSGMAFKHKVTAFHGTVDLDYKETIKVLLTNNGKERFEIHPHDRICQLVFGVVYRPRHLLSDTERTGGLGSTGT